MKRKSSDRDNGVIVSKEKDLFGWDACTQPHIFPRSYGIFLIT